MAKIGIVTIVDGCNYGNRLQNYALHKTVTKLGYDCVTISRRSSRDLSPVRFLFSFAKQFIKMCLGKSHRLYFFRRRKIFRKFNLDYIPFSSIVLAHNQAPQGFENAFAGFIAGSDQIWNVNFDFIREDLDNYLLCFAPGKKRISYAASFGVSSIPKEYRNRFSAELPKFSHLGIREQEGTKIVEEFGCMAEAVLDPTLLLHDYEWESVMKKPQFIHDENGEKFIVTYVMSTRTSLLDSHIDEIKEMYGATQRIDLDIEYISSDKIRNPQYYLAGPCEFLWLIKNAQCVITDSYHASVFSLLFHKPILLYNRQGLDMSNRLKTLMDLVDADLKFDDYDSPHLVPHTIDYSKADRLIEVERQKSLEWLKASLEEF